MPREKIYTRKGDDGTTGLLYGGRVAQGQRAARRPTARSTRPRPRSAWPGPRPAPDSELDDRSSSARAGPVRADGRAGHRAREPPQADARRVGGHGRDGRPPWSTSIDAHRRAVRPAHRVRRARARPRWRRCSTWPAPSSAGPSGTPLGRRPPTVARRPVPQPPVRPAVDPRPLAGGPLAHRPADVEPRRLPVPITFDHRPSPTPRRADVLGVPVPTDGPVPRGQLGHDSQGPRRALGFEGKVGADAGRARPTDPTSSRSAWASRRRSTPAVAAHRGGGAGRAPRPSGTSWPPRWPTSTGVDRRRRRPRPSPRGCVLGVLPVPALRREPARPRRSSGSCCWARLAAGARGRRRRPRRRHRRRRDLRPATWSTRPPGHLTARDLAERAAPRAEPPASRSRSSTRTPSPSCGLGGLLGVNQGSTEPPRLVKLTYTPPARRTAPSPSWARASRTTPAACRSSRPTACTSP